MTRTTVHLLRHGEVFNPDKILYGTLPGFRLSVAGEEMAHLAASWFTGRDVTAIYTSPLERARQTAEPLEAVFGTSAIVEPRVVESANVFEGSHVGVGDGVLSRPDTYKYLLNPFRPSWGEAYEQIADRVLAAVEDARVANAGHEAVIVTHQLPVVCARRRVEGLHLWHHPGHRRCALASVTSFGYDGDRIARIGYVEPAARVAVTQEATVGA